MKIMTIYAHPADTITNCGGTLARHADRGDEIVALILTHGGRIHPNKYAEEWRKDEPDEAITTPSSRQVIATRRVSWRVPPRSSASRRSSPSTTTTPPARCDEDMVDQIAAHVGERSAPTWSSATTR